MKLESFEFTPDELSRELTKQHQRTLYYLAKNGHITEEAYLAVLDSSFVAPMKNDPGLAKRLLQKLFGPDSNERSYVFTIVEINNDPTLSNEKGKPNLKLVKDDD